MPDRSSGVRNQSSNGEAPVSASPDEADDLQTRFKSDDSVAHPALRLSAVVIGISVVLLAWLFLEGSPLESHLPEWGWLLDAALAGAGFGLGAALTVTGLTGEPRFFDRFRRRARVGSLSSGIGISGSGTGGRAESRPDSAVTGFRSGRIEATLDLGLRIDEAREALDRSRRERRRELLFASGFSGITGLLLGVEGWAAWRGTAGLGWLLTVLFAGFAVLSWVRRGRAEREVSSLEEVVELLEAERSAAFDSGHD